MAAAVATHLVFAGAAGWVNVGVMLRDIRIKLVKQIYNKKPLLGAAPFLCIRGKKD